MNGPRSMCKFHDFIFVGGSVTITTADSTPHAIAMTLNEGDLTIASARDWYTEGKLIHNQCDTDNDEVYVSMNNRWYTDDLEIGTGHWTQIARMPVNPTTGFVSPENKRARMEFAIHDVCDTFTVHGEFIYVLCSYMEPIRGSGASPMVSIWDRSTFNYLEGVVLNFGYVYPVDGPSLTRHLFPNSLMAGDIMYFYGSTLQMYGEELSRFAIISMFDTSTKTHGCAYSQVKQSESPNLDYGHHIDGDPWGTYDRGALAVVQIANTRNMNDLDIDANIFTYALNNNYLSVPDVNPCLNFFQDER